MRQYNCAAHLLIRMAGVYTQANGQLDGFVKFCLGSLLYQLYRLGQVIQFPFFQQLGAVGIFLTVFHGFSSLWS